MTAPGVELSGQEVLTAAFGDPRTLFRATATPLAAARDGRAGLFLVESGPRLSGGALEPGFVVLFVPASWLVTTAVAGTEQTAAQLQLRVGRTSYGPRKGATVGNAFSAAGQRFEVGVPERPVTRTAALLPWLVLAGKFLHDIQKAVDEWAAWAIDVVEAWPDDLSRAEPDRAALEEMAARDVEMLARAEARTGQASS